MNSSILINLSNVNSGIEIFEISLNICGYFPGISKISSKVRAYFGFVQVITSYALTVIFGLGLAISSSQGSPLASIFRELFIKVIIFNGHGLANIVRAHFEKESSWIPLMYDLACNRFSY